MAQPWYSREIFFQQSPTHTAAMFHVKQSALTELHPENIQPAAKCNQRLLASLARDSKKWSAPPPTLSSRVGAGAKKSHARPSPGFLPLVKKKPTANSRTATCCTAGNEAVVIGSGYRLSSGPWPFDKTTQPTKQQPNNQSGHGPFCF